MWDAPSENEVLMQKIEKEEMFRHLKGFLDAKGIVLQEGTYTQRIRKGCDVLTDSVNLSQRALGRAKATMNTGFDHLRQAIHERTAPKPSAPPAAPAAPAEKPQRAKSAPPKSFATRAASRPARARRKK